PGLLARVPAARAHPDVPPARVGFTSCRSWVMARRAAGRRWSSTSSCSARRSFCAGARVPGSASGSRVDVDGSRAARLGPTHDAHLPAAAAAAEETLAPVGFQPGHARAGGHVDLVHDLSGPRIDSPQLALVALPGRMPELAVHPGHAGNEPVRLDGAQDRSRIRVDLMDPATAVLSDPECSFRPGEP